MERPIPPFETALDLMEASTDAPSGRPRDRVGVHPTAETHPHLDSPPDVPLILGPRFRPSNPLGPPYPDRLIWAFGISTFICMVFAIYFALR